MRVDRNYSLPFYVLKLSAYAACSFIISLVMAQLLAIVTKEVTTGTYERAHVATTGWPIRLPATFMENNQTSAGAGLWWRSRTWQSECRFARLHGEDFSILSGPEREVRSLTRYRVGFPFPCMEWWTCKIDRDVVPNDGLFVLPGPWAQGFDWPTWISKCAMPDHRMPVRPVVWAMIGNGMATCGVAAIFRFMIHRCKAVRRVRLGRCPMCGYQTWGMFCPECGSGAMNL